MRPITPSTGISSPRTSISPSGHLCLADFGLSVTQRPVDSLLVGKAGTVPYLAPEVFASQTGALFNGTALDIWAFGMLVFEMFHGAEPYLPYEGRDSKAQVVPDVYKIVGDRDVADLVDRNVNKGRDGGPSQPCRDSRPRVLLFSSLRKGRKSRISS
ncbi:hypothetical protein B0H14DRAFT_1360117 [Mycena olivaceomarginata]|nr:hypothetical protein B0H14DRAFT_1360117 [Mycena olivaceomarginata]